MSCGQQKCLWKRDHLTSWPFSNSKLRKKCHLFSDIVLGSTFQTILSTMRCLESAKCNKTFQSKPWWCIVEGGQKKKGPSSYGFKTPSFPQYNEYLSEDLLQQNLVSHYNYRLWLSRGFCGSSWTALRRRLYTDLMAYIILPTKGPKLGRGCLIPLRNRPISALKFEKTILTFLKFSRPTFVQLR